MLDSRKRMSDPRDGLMGPSAPFVLIKGAGALSSNSSFFPQHFSVWVSLTPSPEQGKRIVRNFQIPGAMQIRAGNVVIVIPLPQNAKPQ